MWPAAGVSSRPFPGNKLTIQFQPTHRPAIPTVLPVAGNEPAKLSQAKPQTFREERELSEIVQFCRIYSQSKIIGIIKNHFR